MDTNEKIKIVGTNIQEKANLIWNVANSLWKEDGLYYEKNQKSIYTAVCMCHDSLLFWMSKSV